MSENRDAQNLDLCGDEARLAALRRYEIVDSAPEPAFDDLAHLAAQICGTPLAFINFVEAGRQWFKAKVGTAALETPILMSICAHALAGEELVVMDLAGDPRFADHPVVAQEPSALRFYAGIVLRSSEGHALGTLCVADYKPRTLRPDQLAALRVLARQVMAQLELRLVANRAISAGSVLRKAFEQSVLGMAIVDLQGKLIRANDAFSRMVGRPLKEILGQDTRAYTHPDDVETNSDQMRRIESAQTPSLTYEKRYVRPDGTTFWARATISSVDDEDAPGERRVLAVVEDIDEKKRQQVRDRFFLRLDDAIRGLENAEAIIATTLRLTGELFEVERVAYADFSEDTSEFEILGNWCSPGTASIVGRYPTLAFGQEWAQCMGENRPYVVRDVERHEPPVVDKAAYLATQIRAVIAVPLFKGGRLVSAMAVHVSRPRNWTSDEISLMRAVILRCREALERATAVRALRQRELEARGVSEQRRLALEAAKLGWWHLDGKTGVATLDERAMAMFAIENPSAPLEEILPRIHPDDRQRVKEAIARATDPAVADGYHERYRVVRPDGGVRWLEVTGRADFGEGASRTLEAFVGTVQDVTEQVRWEESLRESEGRFRQLADAMPQIVFSATPEGNVDYFNQQWYDYTGLPEGATGYDSWRHVHTPEGLALAMEKWPEAVRTGRPYEIEYRLRRRDGQYRWHLGRALPVRDWSGKIYRWFGTNTDIHDQKLAAEELRRSRDNMQFVVQGANVGVWYCPLPFDKLIWDAKVKEHFHLAPDTDVTIELFYERLHPEDRARTRAAIDASIANRTAYDIEYRTVSPDGRNTKWIRALGRGYYDAGGDPVQFDGITIDVTEQARAQAFLRESEARYRLATQATNDAIWDWNLLGGIVHWNDAISELTGYAPEEIDGTPEWWFDHIHPDDREEVAQGIRRVMNDPARDHWQDEYRFRRVDGTYAEVLDRGYALRDERGRAVRMLGAMQDLTLRKHAERERESLLESERAAREEAERSNRMKDEFLATLSHELRTPLNAIVGWSQILRQEAGKDSDLADGLETIERNARAQAQIVEDLLDMSRVVSGKMQLDVGQVNLRAVIEASIATVRPAADGRGVRIVPVLEDIIINGDANRLQQVFWNLLSNSIKFTPRGGSVTVSIRLTESSAEVVITDTGEGIAADFLPYVFDRFRQADASTTRRHGGLGLGLAIVKQLTELHGGTVRAASAGAGKGATFTVSLPVDALRTVKRPTAGEWARPAVVDGSPDPASTASIRLDGVHVLVVDDEADARALVRRLLVDRGARVRVAASASEAVALMANEVPDVIVSDLGMPGEDGFSLMRRVRALPSDKGGKAPAVALSAYARSQDRIKALAAGFQMHTSKPVEPAELVLIVANLTGVRNR